MLAFLGQRGRETVQIAKNATAVAKHCRFERRSIFSTEGSFGCLTIASLNDALLLLWRTLNSLSKEGPRVRSVSFCSSSWP